MSKKVSVAFAGKAPTYTKVSFAWEGGEISETNRNASLCIFTASLGVRFLGDVFCLVLMHNVDMLSSFHV